MLTCSLRTTSRFESSAAWLLASEKDLNDAVDCILARNPKLENRESHYPEMLAVVALLSAVSAVSEKSCTPGSSLLTKQLTPPQ